MKTLTLISILVLMISFQKHSNGQCNVNKINIENEIDRYSMTENFYKNSDLENGIKTIYISTNFFGDKSNDQNPFLINIVVTYAWNGNPKEFIPNKLSLTLPSGKTHNIIAETMSRGTINETTKIPSNLKSVECLFEIPLELVTAILSEKSISRLIIQDYKQNSKIDLSNKYKGQLPEMLSCIIK